MSARLAPPPELVWFRGPDAIRFLDDLVSQEIGELDPGMVTRSLLLGPQGKLDFILWVLRGEDEVGLVTEDGRGAELVARLARYRIRVDVTIEPEERELALVVADRTIPEGTWSGDEEGLAADVSWATLDREIRLATGSGGIAGIDPVAYTTARIEAGEPVFGVDVDEKTIPQETGLVEETISFEKGCFLGQELVARLDSRGGRVNRHLRILDFDSPVEPGQVLVFEDREVGTVTTSAGEHGLALVWREVAPGDVVDAGGVGGTVRETPHKSEPAFTGS